MLVKNVGELAHVVNDFRKKGYFSFGQRSLLTEFTFRSQFLCEKVMRGDSSLNDDGDAAVCCLMALVIGRRSEFA